MSPARGGQIIIPQTKASTTISSGCRDSTIMMTKTRETYRPYVSREPPVYSR